MVGGMGAGGQKPSATRLGVILQSSSLEADCMEAVGFDLAEEIMVQASQLAQANVYMRTSRPDLRQTYQQGCTKA